MAANASQLVLCCLPASPPRQTYVDSPLPEHVIIDDLEAVHLLAQVLAGRAKGKALFPRKTPCFRAGFKRLLGKIGQALKGISPTASGEEAPPITGRCWATCLVPLFVAGGNTNRLAA